MSESRNSFIVTAPDPLTEIHVFDSNYQSIRLDDHNLERVVLDVPDGRYSIRFQAGASFLDREVELRNPHDEVLCSTPLDLFSPVPFSNSLDEKTDHLSEILSFSENPPEFDSADTCSGTALIVVRSSTSTETVDSCRENYLSGLKVHGMDGGLLWDASTCKVKNGVGWSGAWFPVEGDACRLRLAAGKHGYIERLMPVCTGWRTLMFFFCLDAGPEYHRIADFSNCSVLLVPDSDSVSLNQLDCRLTELALMALIGGRATPAAQPSAELMSSANPLLLILYTHLYLRRDRPDPSVLACLIEKILDLAMLPGDSRAVAWAGLKKVPPDAGPRWEAIRRRLQSAELLTQPPLLWASWQFLLAQSREFTLLFRPGSLVDFLAADFRDAGPWQVWWSTDNEEIPRALQDASSTSLPENDAPAALERAIQELTEELRTNDRSLQLFASQDRFPPVFTRLGRLINPLRRGEKITFTIVTIEV